MKFSEPVPSNINTTVMLDWEAYSPTNEGIVPLYYLMEIAKPKTNWLLFYAWCYVRTNAFRNSGMMHWDFGNLGNQYASSRDGIRDALNEYLKMNCTEQMPIKEKEGVESIYHAIIDFAKGVKYKVILPSERDKKTEAEVVAMKLKPKKPAWKRWLKIIGTSAAAGFSAGALVPEGWIKETLKVIFKFFGAM